MIKTPAKWLLSKKLNITVVARMREKENACTFGGNINLPNNVEIWQTI
jgi:hypothetical protein